MEHSVDVQAALCAPGLGHVDALEASSAPKALPPSALRLPGQVVLWQGWVACARGRFGVSNSVTNRRRHLLGAMLATGVALGALLTGIAVGMPHDRPVYVVASGLRNPVHAVPAPSGRSGRLFVVEQGGRILIAEGQRILPRPFLDLRPVVAHGGLRGLLSLAFHPRYTTNGLAYVNYVARDGTVVVAEIRTLRGYGIASSRRVLLRAPASTSAYAHFGGLVAFGPDGRLYVSLGDGGSPDAAQAPEGLLGRIVRIRVEDDNPKPETVAWGLRNPWRFAFAPLSSALVIGDVGAERREELDVLPRRLFGRANFGWPAFEGTVRRSSAPPATSGVLLAPFVEYRHRGKRCYAVVGGVVYRGARFPDLRGRYVYGDLCGGIWSVRLSGPGAGHRRVEHLRAGGILTSIVEGADRELLLVSGDGRVVTPV